MSSEKSVGRVPDYLRSVLKILGFNTPGSFTCLSDVDFSRLFIAINSKIRSYHNRSEYDKIRKIIEKDLKDLDQKIDEFELPLGHENLIRSIRNFKNNEKKSKEDHKPKHQKTDEFCKQKFRDLRSK